TSSAATSDCQSIDNQQLCIEKFSVSEETLLTGEQGNLTITMTNPGIQNASGILVLYHVTPANNTSVCPVQRLELAPESSRTINQSLNASTVGTHGLRAAVVDPETMKFYDRSEILTVEVREEPAPGLGGPIDKVEMSLAALIASIAVIIGLGYRQFR
ncbi:MAG: hypothetical protein ABEJ55_08310, partial [Halanaeroarchaeum sp.]